jgi:hypothetical protein
MTTVTPAITLADIQRLRELFEARPMPKVIAFVLSPDHARRGIAAGELPAELDPDSRKYQHIGGNCYIVQAEIPGWSP